MTGSFDVTPDELARHAGQVAGVAQMVARAKNASAQVGVGGVDMYGLLCSPLALGALEAFTSDMDELLQSSADLATALSDGVKKNAVAYDNVNQGIKANYDELGEQV